MEATIYGSILDTIPHPIVFVDNGHVIRYLNKAAEVRYYEKRGYSNLVGRSLFDCHNAESRHRIERIHERLLEGESEIFLKINKDREKITVVGVRNAEGALIGYYERFEAVDEASAFPTA